MVENNITLGGIAELILKNTDFILLCHQRPDGDTVGSALALKYAITALGKTARIACADPLPPNLGFLSLGEEPQDTEGDGLVIAVDVASRSMLGSLADRYGSDVELKIDHHESGEDYARYNYTEPHSAACGEIICELVKLLCVDLSLCATPLYAAISSDTGCFKYGNTTPRTLRLAAELIEHGAAHADINHCLFDSKTPAEVRAINAAYSSMKFFREGQICAVTITNEDKRRLDISDRELGVLNSLTREISGVRVGITLKQTGDEGKEGSRFKLSVRSERGYPANKLCELFSGGGHECAAGGDVIAASAEAALAAVLEKAELFF